jgi:alpha-beta hydrolase superfamily lysophospholipase
MMRGMLTTLLIIIIAYIFLFGLLYFFQEKLIFFPQKLDKSYQFSFDHEFEEINIVAQDGITLNGLLFKADKSKGLIFYLHGNAGSVSSWGYVAKTYTDLNYDVFMLDYRGYGKSEGSIKSQKQLYDDVQTAYNKFKTTYDEGRIIVLGYSIGTGPASKLASGNDPKLLILQAPYYSLTDLVRHIYRIIPTFLLKYKLTNNEYITNCSMPVVVFHGDQDEVIYYGSSLKLRKLFKQQDTLITLRGQGHNGITDNKEYKIEIAKILSEY